MLGARGPNMAIGSACATGTHSIGEAAAIIRRNDADVMIAGGLSGHLTVDHGRLDCMGALSTCNEHPEQASRVRCPPDGFVAPKAPV